MKKTKGLKQPLHTWVCMHVWMKKKNSLLVQHLTNPTFSILKSLNVLRSCHVLSYNIQQSDKSVSFYFTVSCYRKLLRLRSYLSLRRPECPHCLGCCVGTDCVWQVNRGYWRAPTLAAHSPASLSEQQAKQSVLNSPVTLCHISKILVVCLISKLLLTKT